MPELPEVETTLRGIAPHIENKIIRKVIIRHHGLRWPIRADLPIILAGKKITSLERRAKYLLLHTSTGNLLSNNSH